MLRAMTISTTSRQTALLTGNSVTTSFPFTFKVQSADDVAVYMLEDDVETLLDSGYSVSLNGDQNTNPGGSVLFDTAPTADQDFVITTETDATQEQSIQNQSAFNPTVIMEAFDKLTILTQQLQDQIDRGIVTPITSPGGSVLGPAAERAGKYLGFDALGQITTLTALLDGITVAGSWTTALATALGSNWQSAFAVPLGSNWVARLQEDAYATYHPLTFLRASATAHTDVGVK